MTMKCHDPGEDKDEEKIYFSDLPHHEWKWIKRFVGFAILVIIAWSVFAPSSKAHSWYDAKCCNTTDCRPVSGVDANGVPWSEVEDLGDRYRWTSSKSGRVHIFLKGRDNVLPSRDANYHACETEYMSEPLCIYPPLGF